LKKGTKEEDGGSKQGGSLIIASLGGERRWFIKECGEWKGKSDSFMLN